MMKKHLLTWLPFVILAVGLALLLYPTLSDWWNTKHESQAVAGYIRHVANLSRTENEQMLEQARACRDGGRFVVATHEMIASATGTSREVATRTLGRMEDEGILRTGRRQIEILDVERLEELASI